MKAGIADTAVTMPCSPAVDGHCLLSGDGLNARPIKGKNGFAGGHGSIAAAKSKLDLSQRRGNGLTVKEPGTVSGCVRVLTIEILVRGQLQVARACRGVITR